MKASFWMACGVSAFFSACGGGSEPTSDAIQEKARPKPIEDFAFALPAGEGCSFALLIEGTGGNRVINEHRLRIINAGKGSTLTFSRIDDPDPKFQNVLETITLDSNGSVTKTTPNPDGVTQTVIATGHNVFVLFPTDIPQGPLTQLHIGRVEYIYNPLTGFINILNYSGRKIDVCGMIAP